MILVNGEVADQIPVNDRGFQYGDGLFETIEISEGRPLFLEQHLQRLRAGCSSLKIPCFSDKELTDDIHRVSHQAKNAVLKIIVTRGIGGRGYRQPMVLQATRVVSLHPFPDYPFSFAKQGVNARFCTTRLGLNPAIAGIKHLNRLEQVMARAEWDDPEVQEGIMLDITDNVIEGTMTNLMYVKNETVNTDTLQSAGVKGVMRELIKNLIDEHHLTLVEHSYRKETLLAAEEVFVCNSIIGIWPIKKIDGVNFPVGKLTRQLQEWLKDLKEKSHLNG
jgi:4-amino-4-deoxychorismate lyase